MASVILMDFGWFKDPLKVYLLYLWTILYFLYIYELYYSFICLWTILYIYYIYLWTILYILYIWTILYLLYLWTTTSSECMCIHVCRMKKRVIFNYTIIYHYCENKQYRSLEKKASFCKLLISQNHLSVLATVKILQLLVGASQNFSTDSIFSTFLKNNNVIMLYLLF